MQLEGEIFFEYKNRIGFVYPRPVRRNYGSMNSEERMDMSYPVERKAAH